MLQSPTATEKPIAEIEQVAWMHQNEDNTYYERRVNRVWVEIAPGVKMIVRAVEVTELG